MSGWSLRLWLFIGCAVAMALRIGVMLAGPDQLTTDRDLYLGISQELRSGHGFATPGSDPPRPTAFRPPLYPLILAIAGDGAIAIGGLHLVLSVAMVIAVGLAAYRVSTGHPNWWIAPVLVAIDPLLLLYSRQPMTETLCACLSALLIWRVSDHSLGRMTWKTGCSEGLLCGLCLLARPTYGAALGIWLLLEIYPLITGENHHTDAESQTKRKARMRHLIIVVAATALTVSPWVIRNATRFGHPIVTTTHGGYTLWLANNPIFYREVVEGGSSAWDGESLSRWQAETDRELDKRQILGEVARDRELSHQAQAFIQANPGRFMRACLFRTARFWGITPSLPAANGQKPPIQWIVGGYYFALWVGGIAALIRLFRHRTPAVFPGNAMAISLILGFFIVHLVYWTDVRMRAPIMPAVAVLIASAIGRKPENLPEDSGG